MWALAKQDDECTILDENNVIMQTKIRNFDN